MIQITKNITSLLKVAIFISLIILGTSFSYAVSPWTPPTDVFPNDNSYPPIHKGPISQIKEGAIGTSIFGQGDGTIFNASWGFPKYGSIQTDFLYVGNNQNNINGIVAKNNITAKKFCFYDNSMGVVANAILSPNCITSWPTGGT